MSAPTLAPGSRAAIVAELDRRRFADRLRVLDGAIVETHRGIAKRRELGAHSVDNHLRNLARLEAERAALLADRPA